MSQSLRLCAALVATLAGAALIIGDSAVPECKTYQAYKATYAYETDCTGAAAAGTWVIDIPESSGREPEAPLLEAAVAAGLNAHSVSPGYARKDCSSSSKSGTGTVESFYVGMESWPLGQPKPAGAVTYYCDPFEVAKASATVACTASSSSGASSRGSCSLTLTRME
jgi:hypothetical protein